MNENSVSAFNYLDDFRQKFVEDLNATQERFHMEWEEEKN